MERTTKATKKNGWNKTIIVAVCICMLFTVASCGDGSGGSGGSSNGSVSNGASGGNGSSRNGGGYEKILGMEKSAVDKMYGEPVERPEAMGGHGAYIYSDKFSVHYTENGIADYMELGIAGEAFGLKLGDNTDTVQKALDKYNFEFLSMDGSIEYENSEYFIFLTPNEIQLISEFSIGSKEVRDSSSDSSDDPGGYADNPDSYSDSGTYTESSDSIDYVGVLGMDKSDVEASLGASVAKLSDNMYRYSDMGVGYDVNNKAWLVGIGYDLGVSDKTIAGLKLGDSMETVEKTLAEYGFSFIGINEGSPYDYDYLYQNYYLTVTYNEYQNVKGIMISIE